MRRLKVSHVTTYDYANPVSFGDHRMMLRPRDSHDLRIISTHLGITPEPSAVRWMHDLHGNSVAVASFDFEATQLRFESEIVLQHFESSEPDCPIEAYARVYPFRYPSDEIPDLSRSIELQYPDPLHAVDEWAKSFIVPDGPTDTWEMLGAITKTIQRDFAYLARDAEGIQAPADTLLLRSGSCRDFAVLMMEAVRALGLAARFVSGYIFVPDHDATQGGGATHAWLQIYLPGAGWIDFDPTNSIVGNRHLIRVAVAWDHRQALPLWGTWRGEAGSFRGLEVEVSVTEDRR